MDYGDLVADFALRTRENLAHIRRLHREGESNAFEVTQLVNSLLGLLVFPQQRFVNRIPRTPLAELRRDGWPLPETTGGNDPQDLKDLVRLMRNSIAHFNITFQADHRSEICALTLWNMRNEKRTWETTLSVEQLEVIVQRFVDLLVPEKHR